MPLSGGAWGPEFGGDRIARLQHRGHERRDSSGRRESRIAKFMAAAMRSPMPATIFVRCRPWLWHKNIQHTVRYTEMAPDRFRDFWRT